MMAAMNPYTFEVPADAPLAERLEAKRAETKNYERILSQNGQSRWYDQGRRHLAQLKLELEALEQQAAVSPSP